MISLVFLALILLAACNSNEQTPVKTANPPQQSTPAPPPPGDNARRITPAELKTAIASNSAIIVDVRGEVAYKAGHIKGSRQIPYADIVAHVDELPKDKTIATYCS
jgi:3-mercaptopyruvate sulfurtransferase SseA